MTQSIHLDEQDLIRIIADRYDVMPTQVEVKYSFVTKGYGLAEHDEPTVDVIITLANEQKERDDD